MKTKNKPVFISWFRRLSESGPAQRDSGNSILTEDTMGRLGIMGIMGKRHIIETSPVQEDSKMSNGRLSESRPVQRDSPASAGSILKTCPYRPYCPCRPSVFKNCPAQRDSGISNLRIGEHYHRRWRREHRGGIFTMLIKNITGCFMGRWVNESMSKMQNVSAQRYSKMSNLKIETENSLPQRYSRMSNLVFGNILSAKHSEQAMFTVRIKNPGYCFGRLSVLLCWPHGQNSPAQRGSGNSNLGMGLMGVI